PAITFQAMNYFFSMHIANRIFAAAVMASGVAAVYKYWRKRKREQDQARFLKLFEEGDDLEDELALGNAIYK
ncbi:hypothetical protein BHE74_00012116, partial [Ensete ventricosum]